MSSRLRKPARLLASLMMLGAMAGPLPAAAALINVGCPWVPEAINIKSHNFGYPDAAANYSVIVLPSNPPDGATVTIAGQFPHARYFSFQTADGFQLGNFVDSIPDSNIVSDRGYGPNGNRAELPLANFFGYGDSYTITVKFEAPPAVGAREPNTLYAGKYRKGITKQVVMRIYMPDPAASIFGDVALPSVVYHDAQGSTNFDDTPDATRCAAMTAGWNLVNGLPIIAKGLPNVEFKPVTLGGNSGGLYPNGDSTYLRAVTSRNYDDLIVVRAKAPSFPDVAPLRPLLPQVRYWSLCQNELHNTRGVGCIADRDMVQDRDGYFTAVISPADKRPDRATLAQGYNWIDWGPAVDGFVAIRQILSSPGFDGDFQKAIDNPRAPLSTTLGDWAPDIAYCDKTTFDTYAPLGGRAVMAACKLAYAQSLGN